MGYRLLQYFGWAEEQFLSTLECTWVNYIRQTEIRTAELLVPEPCACEFEMAIEN
jgi:hypothetical protein